MATTGGFNARPKLVFAAPLQLGMLAEHELADLFLADRLTAPALRARLTTGVPAGYRVIDLHDVWMGAPALAPQLVAADYRMTMLGVERATLAAAASRLMAAEHLPRQRHRESKTVTYDLRPLVIDLQIRDTDPVAAEAAGVSGAAAELWMRLRHSQERGSGRADEVVAALADELAQDAPETPDARGPALEGVLSVRERLWLAEELIERQAPAPAATWLPPTPDRAGDGFIDS